VSRRPSATRNATSEPSQGIQAAQPRRNAWLAHIILIGVLGFALTCGFRGLDFGYHWDEPQTIRPIVSAIESGILIPQLYLYPGVNFWLPIAVLAPTAAYSLITREPLPARADTIITYPSNQTTAAPTGTLLDRLQTGLKLYARSKHYLLQVRAAYLVLSLLVIVWTYVLLLRWHGRPFEALLGATFVAMSWELQYHARWVTPDMLMTSFVLLSLMCVFLARSHNYSGRWLICAAVSAGLAAGTKYQGGIALVPALIVAYQSHWQSGNHRAPWRRWWTLAAIFVGVYLITTPGTLLDPLRFWHDLWFQITTYSHGWEDHTVPRGPVHFGKLIVYFALSAFSHYWPISLVTFALALFGAVVVVRKSSWDTAILVAVPLFYTLYMAMQRVMFIRNDLVVIPFLGILAAVGSASLWNISARSPVPRLLGTGVLVALLCINASWLWHAAQTIAIRESARSRYPAELFDYMSRHHSMTFALSPAVRSALSAIGGTLPSNTVSCLDSAHYGVLYASEVTDPNKWDATQYDYAKVWFGTYEVNFNYYPSWKGEDRIVVLCAWNAAQLGLFCKDNQQNSNESPLPYPHSTLWHKERL
jgi:hypothetical protein